MKHCALLLLALLTPCIAGCGGDSGARRNSEAYTLTVDDRSAYLTAGTEVSNEVTVGVQKFEWLHPDSSGAVLGTKMSQYDANGRLLLAEFEVYCSDTNSLGLLRVTLYDRVTFAGTKMRIQSMQWNVAESDLVRNVSKKISAHCVETYSVWEIDKGGTFPWRVDISLSRSGGPWYRKNALPPWMHGQ